MSLQEIFKQAEENWLSILTQEVKNAFTKVWLPSHDHLHHIRVWNYAKEILTALQSKGFDFDYIYIEALLIASLFHDTGLTVTFDENHGQESKKLTQDFLLRHPLKNTAYLNEMLEAIVLHDDKTYTTGKSNMQNPGLYQILTVADDLDALGALGLYRYFEIYHNRRIGIQEMQSRIEKNIKSRNSFIKKNLEFNKDIQRKHFERYQRAFYYLKLLETKDLEEIINLFKEELILNETIIFQTFTHSSKLNDFLSEVIIEEKDF